MSIDQSIESLATSSTVIYKEIPGFAGYRTALMEVSGQRERECRFIRAGGRGSKGGRLPKLGHRYVNLVTKAGRSWPFLVHRLILETFVGSCPSGMEACHFPDRDPENNRLENLRWDTHAANMRDAVRHGSMPRGSNNTSAKLTEADIPVIRALYRRGWINKRIAEAFNVSFEAIRRITARRAWTHVSLDRAAEDAVLYNTSASPLLPEMPKD